MTCIGSVFVCIERKSMTCIGSVSAGWGFSLVISEPAWHGTEQKMFVGNCDTRIIAEVPRMCNVGSGVVKLFAVLLQERV